MPAVSQHEQLLPNWPWKQEKIYFIDKIAGSVLRTTPISNFCVSILSFPTTTTEFIQVRREMKALPSLALPALHRATLFFRAYTAAEGNIYLQVQFSRLHAHGFNVFLASVPSCPPLDPIADTAEGSPRSITVRLLTQGRGGRYPADHRGKGFSMKIWIMEQGGDGEKPAGNGD